MHVRVFGPKSLSQSIGGERFSPALLAKETYVRIAPAAILAMLLLLGLWFRVRHLGELALIVDEGVQALAVRAILTHGMPLLDSGVMYLRGLPFLYVQAAFAGQFELTPFWLRLPSVLFGVAVIIPSYMLGKMLFNRRVGLLTAAIMTFSAWEIELSRYARPYTTFQCMYLVSLLCFYRGFMCDARNYKIWFLVTGLIAFSTQELSRVLALCFFIPLFSTAFSFARKLTFGLWAIGFVALMTLHDRLVERLSTMADPLPRAEGVEAVMNTLAKIGAMIGIGFRFPSLPDLSFLVETAQQSPVLLAGLALVPGLATIYLISHLPPKGSIGQAFLVILMLWAGFLYQFGLVLILLALYVVLFAQGVRSLGEPILQVAYGVMAILLLCWASLMAMDPIVNTKQLILAMFGFPNFLKYFLYWLIIGWPIMTIVLGCGCILLLAQYIADRSAPAPLFLLGAIFIPAVLASFFQTYAESRYIFHLYPLVVLVFSMVSFKIVSYILQTFSLKGKELYHYPISIVLVLVILFVSQDAHPLNAWNISNRTYKSAKDPIRSVISWKPYAVFHQDHKSPSLYVRERLLPGDLVVVLGPPYMLGVYHFYLGKVDYRVESSQNTLSYERLKGENVIDYATGSKIIHGIMEFEELMRKNLSGVWIIGDRILLSEGNDYYAKFEKEYFHTLTSEPNYVGLDGKTFALKLY